MPEFSWTPEQVDAITAEEDTLLVANAGTGKTSTVIGKVLWHLGLDTGAKQQNGKHLPKCANPCELSEIATITFTEKGSYDLKKKLRYAIENSKRADELRWQIDRAYIGTIHGFCGAVLRENAFRFGIEPTFRILNETESIAAQERTIHEVVLRSLVAGEEHTASLLKELNLRGSAYAPGVTDHVRRAVRDLRWHAESYKRWSANGVLNLDHLRKLAPDFDEADVAPLVRCDALFQLARVALRDWQEFLEAENVRDFDSLILELCARLHAPEGGAALNNIRRRYRLLIIDEFQDTDFAQRDIAFAIGREVTRPQLFLVGDPKQSIYGFRGADISVWNDTEQALAANGIVIELSRNFRCAPSIVDFVNTTSARAMTETGDALDGDLAGCRIEYKALKAGLPDSRYSGIEWLLPEGGNADALRANQAAQVATRIRDLTETGTVIDKKTEEPRRCEFRDVAILYRARTGLEHFEAALARHAVPYALSGAQPLAEQQEVLDLINVLHLLNNPRDDLRAFAYLRSPFVCLRDELIARLRLTTKTKTGSLLLQAASFLAEGDSWFAAFEHERLSGIERESLQRGLQAINDLGSLVYRLPLDELLEELLQQTGYRLHLLLNSPQKQVLANIDEFLRFAASNRDLDIGNFLELWEVRNRVDNGLPQGPLYSQEDNVVTLSTVHGAKGLEWPVVFIACVERNLQPRTPNELWSDRVLGPLLAPKAANQGPRAQELVRRKALEDRAEESRLVYVATTRARDRLILVGGRDKANSYGAWLDVGVEPHGVEVKTIKEARIPEARQASVSLAWLDVIDAQPPDALTMPLPEPPLSFIRSATELMMEDKDRGEWALRYRHGVIVQSDFSRGSAGQSEISGKQRGTVIHGILEKMEAGGDIAKLLNEVIGELDEPELAELMPLDTSYGEELEKEIRRVVQSDEWKWYTQGEFYSELPFAHLVNAKDWRIGDLDLYRPGVKATVIDFKTHVIDAEEVPTVAQEYAIQMRIYKAAASMRSDAEVRLFFTHPGIEERFTE